jgi:ABC-type antimicrobial peptide transport system permease subunit
MVLTIVGTVVGLAALVATVGLSSTAGNRIAGRFDELAATEIIVSVRPGSAVPGARVIPWDAPTRLARLSGVVAAGTVSQVNVGDRLVSASPVSDPQARTDFRLSVYAASPELFDAARAQLRGGRLFDGGHSARADRVVVLGPNAASQLGINSVRGGPAIRIGDDLFTVIGVLDGVARYPQLLGSVIMPEGTAVDRYRLVAPEAVVVETAIGATTVVARQIPRALRPDQTRVLRVAFPPEPTRVRDAVQSDLSVLLLVLGGVSLLVGALGIANVTLVSVMERTGEIGLRRALGASRRHIAAQFLIESATMGLVGGILGASLGTLVVVAVSAHQQWTPVLDLELPLAAPVVGFVTGLLAGAYPSHRAARMEPVDALRSGT